jgi:dihydrofolate reductase
MGQRIGMANIVLSEFLTLDGVMQGPGDVDEDRSNGFDKGGWQVGFADETLGKHVVDGLNGAGGFLLGRRTYEIFAGYWPNQTADNPVAEPMNSKPKFVVSRTLTAPLSWQNSTLIEGDVVGRLRRLKSELDKDILVIGSGDLAQTLMNHDLVDEYRLMVYPIVLGEGRRLFRAADVTKRLRLADAKPTSTGVLLLTYVPESAA